MNWKLWFSLSFSILCTNVVCGCGGSQASKKNSGKGFRYENEVGGRPTSAPAKDAIFNSPDGAMRDRTIPPR